MKKVIDFSLNNKFAIWILTVMAIVMGIFSSFNMKQELIPDITLPNVSVFTTYPGAAPDEIADEVSIPIEQAVQNLEGVEIVSSSSLANASAVQIQFTYSTDMDKATSEVNEALSSLSLPDGAQEPRVSRLSLDAVPVMALNISDEKLSPEELTQVVESDIQPILEGVEGVANAQISGQQLKKVTIDFDENKLEQFGLSDETVEQLIQASNLTYPLGLTNFDDKVKNLVIDGNIVTIEDLEKLEIPVMGPQPDQGGPGEVSQGQNSGSASQMPEQTPEQADLENVQVPVEIPTAQLGDLGYH